jgi:hypothetical protein
MMATANKPTGKKSAAPSRTTRNGRGLFSRRWLQAALVLALVGGGVFYVNRGPLLGDARAGAAYGARIGCSCRYIDGRELGSCKGDLEQGMGFVFLSENAEAKTVTARVPLLASATAEYRKDWGCVLEKWDH